MEVNTDVSSIINANMHMVYLRITTGAEPHSAKPRYKRRKLSLNQQNEIETEVTCTSLYALLLLQVYNNSFMTAWQR